MLRCPMQRLIAGRRALFTLQLSSPVPKALAKSTHHFSSEATERSGEAENGGRYEIEGVEVPRGLEEFLVVERFVPLVTFHDISKAGGEEGPELPHGDAVFASSLFENNRFLAAARRRLAEGGAGDERRRARLERLAQLSFSHGLAWDALDALFFDFLRARNEAQARWDAHKLELVRFANEVTRRRLERSETLSQMRRSGRLAKLFTQRYYARWMNCYLAPFAPGMLTKFLRARATLALLDRESRELTGAPLRVEFRQSAQNPYFKEPV